MIAEQISHNIRSFRKQHDWTQKELAEKLRTSRSVVAKWENNLVLPDISSLLKLSTVFNITLDHMAGVHSFREDLLKDFKRIYNLESSSFDDEVVELVEYLLMHPDFKDQIHRLESLSIKKQLSIHTLFNNIIDQYEQL